MQAYPNVRVKSNENTVWQTIISDDHYTLDIGMRPTEAFVRFNSNEFLTYDGATLTFDVTTIDFGDSDLSLGNYLYLKSNGDGLTAISFSRNGGVTYPAVMYLGTTSDHFYITNEGSASGDIIINAADDIILTAADDVNINSTGGQINLNGDVVINGTVSLSDTHWEDLRFPAQGINPPGAASDPDINTTTGVLLFDASSVEVIAGVAQMPHGWKQGSSIYPHVHWQPTNTNTGNVLWRFEYDIANVNGTFSGSYTAIDILDAGSGNANSHLLATFGAISMTGYTISSIIKWKLSRIGDDVTDTYNADAALLEFDIHYEVDSFGSDTEYTK